MNSYQQGLKFRFHRENLEIGTFSEEAKTFVTSRPADLIDNPELLKIFNRLPKAL